MESDAEAQRQIEQMQKFIIAEAQDRASEIEAKAIENFSVEKLKVLQSMKDKVRDEYRKKAKALETERAIAESTAINKARLKVFAFRQGKLTETLNGATQSLAEVSSDNQKYCKLCIDLIVQAMLRVLEPKMLVRCRQADVASVRTCLEPAKEKYRKILADSCQLNVNVSLAIDEQNYLLPGEAKDDAPTW